MKLSISQRLIVMITGAILALLLVGSLGYLNARAITADLQYTNDNIITSLNRLSQAQSAFLLIRVNTLYHLYYQDPARKARHEEVVQ